MLRRTATISGLVALALAVAVVRPARAITIVPPSLEFGAQPGQKLETSVKLYNESANAVTLYPSTANFTAKDEKGTPNFDPLEQPTDLAGWIKVGSGPFHLAPNEHLDVPVTINVPAGADPGGHYAALFFGNQPSSVNGGGVAIASKVGVLVILRVEGQINESATITKWAIISPTGTITRPPVVFQAEVTNKGNIHVRPTGTVTIHNMFGGQTATLVFNNTRGAVLPSSARLFDVTWSKGEASAHPGNFFQEVASEWHNFAWGTYTASLDLTYGSSATPQTLTGDIRFTVFPWQLLLVLLVAIVLIVLLLVMGIRQYNAMIIKKAEQTIAKR